MLERHRRFGNLIKSYEKGFKQGIFYMFGLIGASGVAIFDLYTKISHSILVLELKKSIKTGTFDFNSIFEMLNDNGEMWGMLALVVICIINITQYAEKRDKPDIRVYEKGIEIEVKEEVYEIGYDKIDIVKCDISKDDFKDKHANYMEIIDLRGNEYRIQKDMFPTGKKKFLEFTELIFENIKDKIRKETLEESS